jgi:hypothetical protein
VPIDVADPNTKYQWIAVGMDDHSGRYLAYNPRYTGGVWNTTTNAWLFNHEEAYADNQIPNSPNLIGRGHDTMILSVTEAGTVKMISASDLREQRIDQPQQGGQPNRPNANLKDLQAAMWCIAIQKPHSLGQWPTFHFTNKVFGRDLAWNSPGNVQLNYAGADNDNGWMYSPSYANGTLKGQATFHRNMGNGKYRVVCAEIDVASTTPDGRKNLPTGRLVKKDLTTSDYTE